MESYLSFARTFVKQSRRLVLELWEENDLGVELKDDQSPVTKLDKAIEIAFREEVERYFPDHSVLGEEFGLTGASQDLTWVIDPIDGTQSLVNRVPTFGTFLALLRDGEPVLGIVDIPVLNLTVSGAVGLGVLDERGRNITFPSDAPFQSNDIVTIGTARSFARSGDPSLFSRVHEAFPLCRAYYDSFGHYFVGTGRVSGLIEMNVPYWDVVATEALVKAAGGEVRVLSGGDDLTSYRSSICGRKEAVEEICRRLEL